MPEGERQVRIGDLARLRLDADLVTLSGCETGLGGRDAGEVVGLVRALLAAGARRVVASQWRVDDAITRTVMRRVHAHAARVREDARPGSGNSSGDAPGGDRALDLATALSRAHDELLDEHPHPAHWGAFVLMGRN